MSLLDLLNEHVFLVEEEYNGGGGKIAVVADAVEQVQAFVHSILKENFFKIIYLLNNNNPTFGCAKDLRQILENIAVTVPLHHLPPAPCHRRSKQR